MDDQPAEREAPGDPAALLSAPIAAIGAALAAGATSARALAEAALARKAARRDLAAFIETEADPGPAPVLAAADASDRRRADGRARGPLDGIPFAVKDLIDAEGYPTTGGALIMPEAPKARDAPVVARLKAAGAVMIGKTNLHELAYGVTSENPHFGAVRHPLDPERAAGGSSGGSAAAIAAGIAPLALGTDTGCSVRHPAHCCGVVGFKPSQGRLSLSGVIPLVRQLDHVGPLTGCVADAALAYRATAEFDPADPFSRLFAAETETETETGAGAPAAGLRLGALREEGFEEGEPETLAVVETALAALRERLGAPMVDVALPGTHAARRACARLFAGDPSANYAAILERAPERFGADVRAKLRYGLRVSAGKFAEAEQALRLYRRRVEIFMVEEGLAALLCPTCGAPAPRIGAPYDPGADLATVNAGVFNITGQPSISIPCGRTAAGLPIGLMITGRFGADAALLALAQAAEAALAEAGLWAGAAHRL